MLLRPDGLRLPSALSPSRKSLNVWKTSLPRATPGSSRPLFCIRKKPPARVLWLPCIQARLSRPRVVFILRGKIVAQRAEEPEAAQRTQYVHLGRLIEESVGRRHPQRTRSRGAIAVRALRRPRETHARFVHQRLAEGRRQIEAGHVVVRGQRLRRSLPRNHRRAGIALWRAEGAVLIDRRQVDACGQRLLGRDQIVAIDQVLILVVSRGQAV